MSNKIIAPDSNENKNNKSKKITSVKDFSKISGQVTLLDPSDYMKLPYPYEDWVDKPIRELTDDQKKRLEHSLDGLSAIGIIIPATDNDKEERVAKFLSGLKKLFNKEDNWTFVQPLLLSMENCMKCQTCSDECPIYLSSGREEIYRPIFRGEILRRIINKYLKPGGKFFQKLNGADIELNWDIVARLAELAYRCTMCRRCAQACPIGVDNGLITREIRKLFSQELELAPDELHTSGTMKQMKTGSSTGTNPTAMLDIVEFIEEDLKDLYNLDIKIPIDKQGADILLIHNFGEYLSWPENIMAFAIIFEKAGISWTLSSEMGGYDSVNYGLFYDDVQLARVALEHIRVAKKLGVKKIVMGECGHAHKALMPIADRILVDDNIIPRESAFPVLEEIVFSGKLKFNPNKNNFPVTLHDPCNTVRSMGIVEPQRKILRYLCPQFVEMEPHGVNNYCCGGGSGFAIFQGKNFPDWRNAISFRMKFKQVLEAFKDNIEPSEKKYVCAPCSNCKGAFRDGLTYFNAFEKCGIIYGGLVELIVNAMTDLEKPFIEWQLK
ncbi:MAG TPA: (Fe-S)-binding protein [Ignavibacteriaceae bacterium]|nr:(Fe-S)-binding protein [Ignavibacteriaceae bacterium]